MAVAAMLSILPRIEECHVLNYVSLKNVCQGPNPSTSECDLGWKQCF